MLRLFISCVLTATVFQSTGFSQIKIDGPKEGTVGYRVKGKLTLEVDDPKVSCFPANDDWMVVKDAFSGLLYIDFVPGKKILGKAKSLAFTYIVAGNKGGKTYLETWTVLISADEDATPFVPPAPQPDDVTKSDLYKSLLAAYKVNPSGYSKDKLVTVYTTFVTNVKGTTYKSNKEAWDGLVTLTKASLADPDLRGVRDAVADYLIASAGQSGIQWSQAKITAAMEKVIACLKAIPD